MRRIILLLSVAALVGCSNPAGLESGNVLVRFQIAQPGYTATFTADNRLVMVIVGNYADSCQVRDGAKIYGRKVQSDGSGSPAYYTYTAKEGLRISW